MVVEQDASWPENSGPTRVATLFMVKGTRVSAALRFATTKQALEFASTYVALMDTE